MKIKKVKKKAVSPPPSKARVSSRRRADQTSPASPPLVPAPAAPPLPYPKGQERVKMTIQLANNIYLAGKTQSRVMGQSYNAYIGMLIYRDTHGTPPAPISVTVPPPVMQVTGAAAPMFPQGGFGLPKQRDPLEPFGDLYRYKTEHPSDEAISIPWRYIYEYEQYIAKHYPDGNVPANLHDLGREIGWANTNWAVAADQAMELGEFDRYMRARKLAIKRGFTPDDEIPLEASMPKEQEDAE